MADFVATASLILQCIKQIKDLKDDLEINQKQSERLINRISVLEPCISAIEAQRRPHNPSILQNILVTLQEAHNFLREFLRKWWVKKILFRRDYAKEFNKINDEISRYITDLNLLQTEAARASLDGMNKRLEQERAADQEDLERKMAATIDDLEGASSQQEKALAKLGCELSDANEVIARLKEILKKTDSHTEVRKDEIELIEKLEKGGGSGELWICLLYTSPSPRDRG